MPRFLFALLFISTRSLAQSDQLNCPCSQLFNESIEKTSSVYAGFHDKVTDKIHTNYDQLVKRLKEEAAKTTSKRACYEIIKRYTAWFGDGHLSVTYRVQSSPALQRRVVIKKKNYQKATQNGIEGTWATADQKEQYVIIKDPSKLNKYIAVTIATGDPDWEPGMVKVEFDGFDAKIGRYPCMFYLRDFHGIQESFLLTGNRLEHYMGAAWYRSGTVSRNEANADIDPMRVEFKQINPDFIYLKLGSFMQRHVNKLDSLVKTNYSAISQTKHLIIDLRGNSGGDGHTSNELFQLIYTDPVIYPSSQIKSSPEMIQSVQQGISWMEKNDSSSIYIASRKRLLEKLKENPGELVSTGDSTIRRMNSVYRYPEKVAVLMDKGSASAAEYFIFETLQSKKVTRFGGNSAGAMDYGNVHELKLSCEEFTVMAATSRNGWIDRFGLRIDNIGFRPDVHIPEKADWIVFVVKYWNKDPQ
jgi:hypothetical protein